MVHSHRFVQTLLSLKLRNLSLSHTLIQKKKKKNHTSNLKLIIIKNKIKSDTFTIISQQIISGKLLLIITSVIFCAYALIHLKTITITYIIFKI